MKDHEPIDISEMPEVAKLVDELSKSDKPRMLRRGEEDVAILTPVASEKQNLEDRKPSPEQLAAARSAAGSWTDFDAETFIEQIYRDRENWNRPPVKL
jgi:hypothetical protein